MIAVLRSFPPAAALAVLWLLEPLGSRPGLRTPWTVAVGVAAIWLWWSYWLSLGQEGLATRTVLRTRGIEIVDEEGRTRLRLSTAGPGLPMLQMLNAEGKLRLALREGSDALELCFYHPAGQERLGLAVTDDGIGGLTLVDSAGQPRLGVTIADDDTPMVRFLDQQGKQRLLCCLRPDGISGLWLADATDYRVGTTARADGPSRMKFHDAANNVRIKLEVQPDGSPELSLYDAYGREIVQPPADPRRSLARDD